MRVEKMAQSRIERRRHGRLRPPVSHISPKAAATNSRAGTAPPSNDHLNTVGIVRGDRCEDAERVLWVVVLCREWPSITGGCRGCSPPGGGVGLGAGRRTPLPPVPVVPLCGWLG